LNGLLQPTGGRRVRGTGAGIVLILVGAILRFALVSGSLHGLNLHVAGVVLMLAGVVRLLLALLLRSPLKRRRNRAADYDPAEPVLAQQHGAYPGQPTGDGEALAYEDQPPA
jgi:hypothetical protein